MATAQQQIPAQQVQNATNGNNILQTTVQLVQRYWVRVTVKMREGAGTVNAGNLPYILVAQDGERWTVLSTGITGMSNGRASFGIPGGRTLSCVHQRAIAYIPDWGNVRGSIPSIAQRTGQFARSTALV